MKSCLPFQKINPDTIDTMIAANGELNIRFKDDTLVKVKLRAVTLVHGGDATIGNPVFPECLLIGGKAKPATGGKVTRCVRCGSNTTATASVEGVCFQCIGQDEGLGYFIQALSEMGGTVAGARTFVEQYIAAHPPATLAKLSGDDYLAEISRAYIDAQSGEANITSYKQAAQPQERPTP